MGILEQAQRKYHLLNQEPAVYKRNMRKMVCGDIIRLEYRTTDRYQTDLEQYSKECKKQIRELEDFIKRESRKKEKGDSATARKLKKQFEELAQECTTLAQNIGTVVQGFQKLDARYAETRVPVAPTKRLLIPKKMRGMTLPPLKQRFTPMAVHVGTAAKAPNKARPFVMPPYKDTTLEHRVAKRVLDECLKDVFPGNEWEQLQADITILEREISALQDQMSLCNDPAHSTCQCNNVAAHIQRLQTEKAVLEHTSEGIQAIVTKALKGFAGRAIDYGALVQQVETETATLRRKLEQEIKTGGFTPTKQAALYQILAPLCQGVTEWTVQQAKLGIYESRFGKAYAFSSDNENYDRYIVKWGDPAVLAVMRLTLGDKYFTADELQASQAVIEQVHALQADYPYFPIIIGNNSKGIATAFLGGDQGWFDLNDHPQKAYGGCGTLAAANTLANLAWKDPQVAKKLGYPAWNQTGIATQGEYLAYMEDIYETVKPFEVPFEKSLGIFDVDYYRNALVKYAFEKDIYLKSKTLDKFFDGPYDKIALQKLLDSGQSVSFLNAFTELTLYYPHLGSAAPYDRHWVQLTRMEGDKIYLSTWGEECYILYSDLENFWNTHLLQGLNAMVAVEPAGKEEALLELYEYRREYEEI